MAPSPISNEAMIRVNILSNRVFVAQIRRESHGARECEFEHLIVIPTNDDCVVYGIRPGTTQRTGFFEVYHTHYRNQREMIRLERPIRPIIRLPVPTSQDGMNDFRRRILNTKHLVWYRSIEGKWCCADWVLDILYTELDIGAFPAERLWKLIDHLEKRRCSSKPITL
ncbi:hypothetical protein Pst134EA_000498 [Puccinia striiformis f. sp. tritici]|nr:hypothetical protein Pst134EA_000498 [Puccinia striiformis f. sp. tritici]KAH9466645.1 hypothetical protein Pst134EB_001693 [Puccinia striiformis f. sp. tritici]KAH9473427.1 hypothetical protein Pst134EA_000498 [Puccinia striiformis f. sp. tritici]KAI9607082.1 hypothetical protein KEM48_001574 [Puccinia striiformis f. sp. tritici PST-130]